MTFKEKTGAYAAFILALLFTVSPFSAFAQSASTSSENSQRGVCLRLMSIEQTLSKRLTDADSLYRKAVDDHTRALLAASAEGDSSIAESRGTANTKLNVYVATKINAADTPEKKTAVQAFKTRVLNAETARRERVDKAKRTFWSDVKALINTKAEETLSYSMQFKGDIKAKIDQAKVSCAEGKDPKIVRDELHAQLSTMQQQYKDARISDAPIASSIDVLVSNRVSEIMAANQAFSTEIDAAIQQLRSVL